jgi:Domain of unknown function (DUF1905)
MSNKTPLVEFNETICKNPSENGWTCVKWSKSVDFFKTRGRVKVIGTVNGEPFETSFMALGDGQHMLPLKKSLLKKINKGVGDVVKIVLYERVV